MSETRHSDTRGGNFSSCTEDKVCVCVLMIYLGIRTAGAVGKLNVDRTTCNWEGRNGKVQIRVENLSS